MIKGFVHLALLIPLLISGCVPTLPPLPSNLPTNSPAERIAAVENHLPDNWFTCNALLSELQVTDNMKNERQVRFPVLGLRPHSFQHVKRGPARRTR